MNLYSLSAASYRSGGFAAAGGYGPIADLWFLSHAFQERRRAFWKVNPGPPGLSIEPNARAWPDFLENCHSPPSFFVSERVVASLRSIDAPLGRVTEMPIAEINAKALRNQPPPRYFVVETFPGIEVDLVATGFKLDARGKAILKPLPQPWPPTFYYRPESWNGTDLFDVHSISSVDGPCTDLYCTERVKELAAKEGWTNTDFTRLVMPGN
jgi:hypothetical protein